MAKVKFTTSLDEALLKKIKKQAIDEGRPVSEILELLIMKYLDENSK